MKYKLFSYYHIHDGLTQEKLGSEEVRLAPLTPLPTILSKTFFVLFCPPKKCFVTPYTICLVLGTPTRCSMSHCFRGSPSLITPHFPISNYASASPFWKRIRRSGFPNTLWPPQTFCLAFYDCSKHFGADFVVFSGSFDCMRGPSLVELTGHDNTYLVLTSLYNLPLILLQVNTGV